MTTYPRPFDPVGTFSRPDGTSTPHSDDHGRIIDLPVNAKKYLRGDGGTESGAAVIAFAAAANAAGGAYIPKGTYTIPDGASLFPALAANVVIRGAGRQKTIITTKDAYAFQTPSTGNLDRVALRDFATTLRAGSVSGGGIKAVSNYYHSGWDVQFVDCDGVSTSVDPLVHLDGFISSYVEGMRLSAGGGDGLKVESTGFVSNRYSLHSVSVQGVALSANTYAGIRIVGGSHPRIVNSTVESNHGHGIYLSGVVWATIEDVWFEDNWNTDVDAVSDCLGVTIARNKFHYHNPGAAAGARHILLSGTAGYRHMHAIERNIFQDPPASGVAIEVGTNVEQTYIANNRGTGLSGSTGGGTILDNGTGTRYGGNDSDAGSYAGTGSPEGVVTARVGSTYKRVDGGAGTSFYVKEYGTGNTNWVAK